jgi:hypothetical protein
MWGAILCFISMMLLFKEYLLEFAPLVFVAAVIFMASVILFFLLKIAEKNFLSAEYEVKDGFLTYYDGFFFLSKKTHSLKEVLQVELTQDASQSKAKVATLWFYIPRQWKTTFRIDNPHFVFYLTRIVVNPWPVVSRICVLDVENPSEILAEVKALLLEAYQK